MSYKPAEQCSVHPCMPLIQKGLALFGQSLELLSISSTRHGSLLHLRAGQAIRESWDFGGRNPHWTEEASCLVLCYRKNSGMRDAWVELQALPLLETASGCISNTPFLLPLVPGSVGTRESCHCRREQSSVWCSCREQELKGEPVLVFAGCFRDFFVWT